MDAHNPSGTFSGMKGFLEEQREIQQIILGEEKLPATAGSEEDKKFLLSLKEPQGGFAWCAMETRVAKKIIKVYPELKEPFGWLHWSLNVSPRSKYNHLAEDYVKRVILEEFGVLCQLQTITKDRFGNDMWLMSGVCPFHRRVHRQQHWCIHQKKDDTIVECFHKNKIYGREVQPFIILSKLPF